MASLRRSHPFPRLLRLSGSYGAELHREGAVLAAGVQHLVRRSCSQPSNGGGPPRPADSVVPSPPCVPRALARDHPLIYERAAADHQLLGGLLPNRRFSGGCPHRQRLSTSGCLVRTGWASDLHVVEIAASDASVTPSPKRPIGFCIANCRVRCVSNPQSGLSHFGRGRVTLPASPRSTARKTQSGVRNAIASDTGTTMLAHFVPEDTRHSPSQTASTVRRTPGCLTFRGSEWNAYLNMFGAPAAPARLRQNG